MTDSNGRQAIIHSELVPIDGVERAAMAQFCKSLSPEDWMLLEMLSERVRNDLLRHAIAVLFRWRKRRTR
ncbi:MAG TPA: hypothetical protein VGI10_04330 [Polyangiaceae bacterium]|jgi:hypothetical protein